MDTKASSGWAGVRWQFGEPIIAKAGQAFNYRSTNLIRQALRDKNIFTEDGGTRNSSDESETTHRSGCWCFLCYRRLSRYKCDLLTWSQFQLEDWFDPLPKLGSMAFHTRIGAVGSCWLILVSSAMWLQPNRADAFRIANRWTSTAIDGGTGAQGGPITLTWSFVPDGTAIPGGAVAGESSNNSSLIAFFDSIYPGGSGSDLTARPWFSIFDDSFTRLEELSGLTYVYEPNDDGSLMYTNNGGGSFTGGASGSQGVRGDVRIGGHSFNGSSVLAYNFFPNSGEMVIDTGDGGFYGNTTNASRGARNVIMHEAAHGLGIEHVESSNALFLMEPFINTSFDGPQHDDILALHRNYGDALEKSNGGDGNNNSGDATSLGPIGDGQTASIGTDADGGTAVGSGETDFVSIDDNSDFDYFSFVVSGPSEVDLLLTPKGPTYNEGPQTSPATPQSPLVTSALSDLTLDLFDTDGTTSLGTANVTGAGGSETLTNISLAAAGTYFARVSGADDNVQLYQLDVAVTAVPEPATYALGILGLMAFAFVGWRLRRTR